MPLMRNPFRSARNPADLWSDENGAPIARTNSDDVGSEDGSDMKGSRPLSIRSGSQTEQNDAPEYKLSEINDSGVYLPPSPPEKKWLGSMRSFGSSNSTCTRSTRNTIDENEPFNISRESFDSYRRSFDISARSPVIPPETFRPRQSLDARRMRLPGTAVKQTQINPPSQPPDERFEEVGLEDAAKPAKRGFLSRFGGSSSESTVPEPSRPGSSGLASGHGLFGRKKGAAQEAELGAMSHKKSTDPASAQ